MDPLISIVLPTYNVRSYIERCLKSCLYQNRDNFEIVVVDDCSTDDSIEIVRKYAKKDSRIKIIFNKKNLGTYHARKKGVLCAKGSHILFLDPDDELAPNALDNFLNNLALNPEIDLILFDLIFIPKLSFFTKRPKVPIGYFFSNLPETILKTKRMSYGTAGKLYSKRSLINGFDILAIPESERLVYGEDLLIFSSTIINVKYALGIPNKFYIYHRNIESITEKKNPDAIIYSLKQLKLVGNYLNKIKINLKNTYCINIIQERIMLDSYYLRKKLSISGIEYIYLLIKIFIIDPSLSNFFKLLLYIVSSKRL